MRNNMKRPLVHPAAARGDYLADEAGLMRPSAGPAPASGFDPRFAQEDWEMMRGNPGVAPPDHHGFADAEDIAASRSGGGVAAADPDAYEGSSVYGDYASNVGPQMAAPGRTPSYQRDGRDVGAGYLNNPLDEEGRQRMGEQFWEAPLGGHVRRALTGQELLGNRITAGQARMAEQGLAGLTAVGVGVPAFLAAVSQLTTPQSAETIPM